MPKEIVTIHTGQAGVQMGSALWELYCIEHGVNSDGKLSESREKNLNDRIETLFCESNGQYVPRTLFVDLEPTVIDEIKSGVYKNLFGSNTLISGKEDAANNYSRGFYTIGKDKIESIMDSIRKVVNNCESVSAFQIMHSYAGGTGSGLTSLLLSRLSEAYGKKFRVSVGIFPSSTMSQSTVDPYNSLLHTHSAIEHIDCGILFDNESLYTKAINHLNCSKPTYSLMNRLVSQMVTCVFLSHRYRYEGTHHIDVDELLTNLVPYPRIHFPVLSYSPIVSPSQIKHEKMNVAELTRNVFQGDAHFLDCSFENNKYLSCCLLYRGFISPRSVYDAVARVKCDRKISFVDWCPTGFKLGLNTIPPVGIPNLPLATPLSCLCMVSGNVGIKEAWKRDRSKFDLIFNKRAFVHWFVGEGLEEGEFLDAREDIVTLENDYEEIAKDSEDVDKYSEETRTSRRSSQSRTDLPRLTSIKKSKSSTKSISIHESDATIPREKISIKSGSKRMSFRPSNTEELSPPIKNQVGLESSIHSDTLDRSNNAFILYNNSQKYYNDLDYGLEIEEPSWIDGSRSHEPRVQKESHSKRGRIMRTKPRNIPASIRRGPESKNNYFPNSGIGQDNYNVQIDNLFSKMDVEILNGSAPGNYQTFPQMKTNPFSKFTKWESSNYPEHPFKYLLNSQKNEEVSSRVSSFIRNSSSTLFPITPVHQLGNNNSLTFTAHHKSTVSLSNSQVSRLLPLPQTRYHTSNMQESRSFHPYKKVIKRDTVSIQQSVHRVPLNGPILSSFVPTLENLRTVDTASKHTTKKRNLIMSPIESLDCEATKCKLPKFSFINFIYKKFRVSKIPGESKKVVSDNHEKSR